MASAIVSESKSRNDYVADSTEVPALTTPELPLVPFERLMLGLDAPETPIVFRVMVRFDGPFNRPVLEEAFRLAIARQPMLTSIVVNEPQGPVWKKCPELPVLNWGPSDLTQDEVIRLPIEWIDLSKQPGTNVRCFPIENGLTVFIEIHHSCCDGQGARQMVCEWMAVYDQLLNGQEVKFAFLDPSRLETRGKYRLPTPPIGFRESMRNLLMTIRGRTIRLKKRLAGPASPDHLLEFALLPSDTAELRKRLKAKGYTVNDAAVAASFLAFAESFPERMHRRRYITLLHPVDLRWPSDLRTPACNRVGICFPRRRVRDLQDRATFMESVRDQMQYIKRRYVGAEMLRGLSPVAGKRGLADLLQRLGYFVPSLQFTCLGDSTRALNYQLPTVDGEVNFHGLKLDRVVGTMQLGAYVPLSLAASETSQRLSLTLHASSRYVTAEQAEQFLNKFVEHLLTIVP